MRDLDVAESGKRSPDVIDEPARDQPWIGFPGAHAPRPLQPVAADDPVVIIGTVGIADGPAIAHDIVQNFSNRPCHHDEGRHRQ